jgi:hypothetical protein
MSAATKTLHTPSELALISCNDRTNTVVFQSASASRPDRPNVTTLDTLTGAILCDCQGATNGKQCWHADHITAAWQQSPTMQVVRWLSLTALLNQGRKASAMVEAYRTRCGRPLQDDVLTLVASRSEWRRRAARAEVQLPVATIIQAQALVAEQETLTHSDRAIDAGRGGLTVYHASRDLLARLPLPLCA